jgi:hypothetical protein
LVPWRVSHPRLSMMMSVPPDLDSPGRVCDLSKVVGQ